ncbi:hypothetical protein [Pleurochrysis sp. endemic virus 2]|nr:hypothetical protein [Pleurochrysis sp. endemic virus 2]
MTNSVNYNLNEWTEEYYDELTDLYAIFKQAGIAYFGNAFHQLGTFQDFCAFTFKHTLMTPVTGK